MTTATFTVDGSQIRTAIRDKSILIRYANNAGTAAIATGDILFYTADGLAVLVNSFSDKS